MNCENFERTLGRLLGGEVDDARRPGIVDELRRHGERCDVCRGSLVLIDAPDLVDAPPTGYWETFDARLAERIGAAERPGRPPVWLAAAAAVAVVLAGAWAVSTLRPAASDGSVVVAESTPDVAPEELPAAEDAAIGWFSAWDQDDEAVPPAEPDVWTGTAGWTDGLFPETERLAPEAQNELLRWLEEQTS